MATPVELSAQERVASRRLIVAKTAGNLGDVLANAKTTLTWLMDGLGAAPWMTGLLVPIRESGSMLPQLWMAALVQRFTRRKWAALWGALGQAIACLAIAAAAWWLPANAAGIAVLVALAVFALARASSSISSKDLLARAIPKGARGRIGGLASSIAGVLGALASLAAITMGRASVPDWAFALIVAVAGFTFALSGLAFLAVHEPVEEEPPSAPRERASLRLLWRDETLRRFVLARGLLLGSALGAPYFVLFGRAGDDSLAALGAFILASGLASASSSWIWGRVSDRSAAQSMRWGGSLAGVLALAGATFDWQLGAGSIPTWGWALVYFVFTVGYSGVRMGRKTYVVDVAKGDRRTIYVASSNTAIAILLLVFGGIGAALQGISNAAACASFGLMSLVGAALTHRLDEVDDA